MPPRESAPIGDKKRPTDFRSGSSRPTKPSGSFSYSAKPVPTPVTTTSSPHPSKKFPTSGMRSDSYVGRPASTVASTNRFGSEGFSDNGKARAHVVPPAKLPAQSLFQAEMKKTFQVQPQRPHNGGVIRYVCVGVCVSFSVYLPACLPFFRRAE